MPGDEEFRVSFGDLERGKLFPIKKIEELEYNISNGIKKKSLKALIIDDELEIYPYLPKKVMDDIDNDLLAKINAAGAGEDGNKMYKVCFYGNNSTGVINSFVGRVHAPDKSRNENLFKKMGLLMAKYGANKRKAADEGEAPSPQK